jgi:dethiobiotin synthetase
VAELCWPPATAVGLVEGVGGPRSPLAADGDTVDLTEAVAADGVVLVAPADLGAINAVRLAAAPFEAPVIVVLNRFDPADALQQANRSWLELHGFVVVDQIRELGDRLGTRG